MRQVLIGLAVITQAACVAPSDPGDVQLEVGTGVNEFVALEDGDDVLLGEGAQGGYHIWASLRTSGLDPNDVATSFSTQPMRIGRPVQRTERRIDFDAVEQGDGFQAVGLPLVLSYPECHINTDVQIMVVATDADGNVATATRIVRARHPDDFPPCPFE